MNRQKTTKNKTIMLVAVTLLITMTMTSVAIDIDKDQYNELTPNDILKYSTGGRPTNTHKVLGEQGTATWCPYCPSMGYWLEHVQGDFVYVALVADMNGYASQRCSQLGLTGYPTTFFDGGYTSVVGGQSSAANLQNAYDQCEDRTVADLTVSVAASLDEDEDVVEVVTFIDNNEASSFDGNLRVFVCEKESRWDDYDGDPYVNAMIGYAPNTMISVPAGQSISVDGSLSFPDITVNNILIIAAVYDSTNDYVQQCATTTPVEGGSGGGINVIPPVLSIEYPAENNVLSGVVDISGVAHHPEGDGNLKWTLVQIDENDWLNAEGTSEWSYQWDTTSVEDGVHTIRAVTSDGTLSSGVDKISVLVSNHNVAPNTPSIPTGPEDAIAGELLTFSFGTSDSNDDDVKYGIDWDGDDEVDEWTDFYPSGETVEVSHIYTMAGTHNIQVKAMDIYETESSFSPSAQVVIYGSNTAPTVTITKPTNAIYMNNEVVFSFPKTIIIGAIDIMAEADDVESEIDYVELYVDNSMVDDMFSGPYDFTGVTLGFGKHIIKVVAYDMSGLSGEAEISVFKLF